ncbi:hypothetical protein JCM10450v2_005772 [Rhodotorula kratochvilovae]
MAFPSPPAHMFTSFLQYLLLSPAFTNILNVYALCNFHDLTWGNRPEEKVSNDLGAAPVKGDVADVVVRTDEKDIKAAYHDALHVLATPPPKEVVKVDVERDVNASSTHTAFLGF